MLNGFGSSAVPGEVNGNEELNGDLAKDKRTRSMMDYCGEDCMLTSSWKPARLSIKDYVWSALIRGTEVREDVQKVLGKQFFNIPNLGPCANLYQRIVLY